MWGFHTHLQTCAEWRKNLSQLTRFFLAESNKATLSSVLILPKNTILSTVYVEPRFMHFCDFCWWFHCLKWLPGVPLKCWSAFLSSRDMEPALQRRICELNKLPFPGMSHSAVCPEFKVRESAIYLIRLFSLNRNSHKTRLHIDWVTKVLWPGVHRNLAPGFP